MAQEVTMLILAVNLTMTPGHENEVTEMFRKLQAATRQEPGCIAYVAQRSRENPRHYLVYEQYKDESALEEHRNSAHFKKFATDGVFRFVEERRAEFFDEV
jgi:quinol monooxygenase YgiN